MATQTIATSTLEKALLTTLTAYRNGDFSVRMPLDWTGMPGKIADTLNAIIDSSAETTAEFERVAHLVGKQGKVNERVVLPAVKGSWARLVESSNALANDLVSPMNEMIRIVGAVAEGDLSQNVPMELDGLKLQGQFLKSAQIVNTMVARLGTFSSEVTRVAREVGTEGKLGGQAEVAGVSGTWKDLTESVNGMAANLTWQVRAIADVTTAVANGDLTKTITVEAKGEILQLKNTINTMVDQLSSFSSEVTRVAREVGTEGKLGGQAEVIGVSGTWRDLTESVNGMAANLTSQVRNIAEVTTAVANGDLGKKITVNVKGEILELKETINTMVDQLSTFADEVTRVAREVGTEGKLGGQAEVIGVSGTWRDLTESVNGMAANLTSQVRNIAQVTTAVANGDLTKKITVDAKGEILELKSTVNTMVDQLSTFGAEVTRMAREVGTDGKLGGQAEVIGVSGTWRDLTESVNGMAANLTSQVRNIAEVTIAVANGDLGRKITVDVRGEFLQLKEAINTMVDQLRSFASEVTRVAREVGSEGKLGGQAIVPGVAGTWKDLTESVNSMASNLTSQVRNIAQVTTAVANGDLGKKITVDVKGEILDLKDTVNTMVDQLNSFASEVTRVAREVGTDGKLGGQAEVRGISGTWKDLTDNVNFMASNLTSQVRGIAKVVTAVAMGDLKKRLTLEAKGEIAELADTINDMTDTLALFADQVTSVAREVGTEGRLGGQANVPGVAGTWKDLTDSVNGLAANLTSQVRAIANVATAVTKGDLTRSVRVDAKGEVADLKDNVNEMIRNLRETTQQNSQQDWLKTNLAKFTRLLQGQRDLTAVSRLVLSELAPLINAQHGVFYMMDEAVPEEPRLKMLSAYAYRERKHLAQEWRIGEGIVGQCALEKQRILLTNVPHDYVEISSGLGTATPLNIIDLPIVFEDKVKAVVEMASFTLFSPIHQTFLDQLAESIGIVLNTIEANMRTEELLKQSQSLAKELGSQKEELRQTNEELEQKARLLEEQKVEVERKKREVEAGKMALEEKASQLTLTSRYKSEFLSNMSHELRTPLNSLLILAQQLAENPEQNLSERQVEFARTIQGAGKELLSLINEILDLSKIESGTVTLDLADVTFTRLRDQIERNFRHVAESRHLQFGIELADNLPIALYTDEKRLQQVLKNLLSNAFKFTEQGSVAVRIETADAGWSVDHAGLNQAGTVIAFIISDTGIGIPADRQRIIFEAFQQAESSITRKYGGTGLGLSISREIARLLGGELRLASSEPGRGSTFVLFLPLRSPAHPASGDKPEPAPEGDRPAPALNARVPAGARARQSAQERSKTQAGLQDDRENLAPGDSTLLIIEDDRSFADILLTAARKAGFKGVVIAEGKAALEWIAHSPPTAITLDLYLPDLDGWVVLEHLKRNPDTRHIPVEIISIEENTSRALKYGAFASLVKPVTTADLQKALAEVKKFSEQAVRELLIADHDAAHRQAIVALIGDDDVHIKQVGSARQALAALGKKRYDCVVLALNLPDMSGADLIGAMQEAELTRDIPILIYGANELPHQDQERINALSSRGIVKDVHSPERLFDETALFLHRVIARMPADRRQMVEALHQNGGNLSGRKVLVVDDDVRNIFALTSVLERSGMNVISAENGRQALALLAEHPDTDIVLMDIMMPEMDGLTAMRRIREDPKFETLPIIALTAKAMKEDRATCLEAGATDYVSKPVDTEQLLSLMRICLQQS
ncbi:MAG: sensor histidine kinase [Moraxellaceae bacterium]|nr:sensor histidine kinase [Moraxellaceae bacterium]